MGKRPAVQSHHKSIFLRQTWMLLKEREANRELYSRSDQTKGKKNVKNARIFICAHVYDVCSCFCFRLLVSASCCNFHISHLSDDVLFPSKKIVLVGNRTKEGKKKQSTTSHTQTVRLEGEFGGQNIDVELTKATEIMIKKKEGEKNVANTGWNVLLFFSFFSPVLLPVFRFLLVLEAQRSNILM